ncbi:hypothetical protein B0T20DRAFT_486969 [Sordaria brevicollis]|uniref:Uncharacterized protein n=1 Tax=Sordaria brevicollis TaxID=83679 RepID=A0AAE0P945_SORBR|nr:hypothetical protein B0T20DRAFT_486969 [Sordaria brevicollis]
MASLYDIPPSLFTRAVDDDTHKNNVPKKSKPGQKDRNSSSGVLKDALFMINAAICHFLLLTFECSDIQPLLAFFFWPAHVVIFGVLIFEDFCLRRFSTNPPKHAHAQARSNIQRDCNPVFLLDLLCAYWIMLLRGWMSADLGSTLSIANGFPIENSMFFPDDHDDDEERERHYTSVELELMLHIKRLANQAGHSFVQLAKSVEEMAARDLIRERKLLGPPPQCEDEYGISCNPWYTATNLARAPPSPGGSMEPQDPGDCSLEDLEDFDFSGPTSFEGKAPPINEIKSFASSPDKSTWGKHYPWEREHKGGNDGRPLVIPATYRVPTAKQRPDPNFSDPNFMFTYSSLGLPPYIPGVHSGTPMGSQDGSPKRMVDKQMELLVERYKQGPLPKTGANYTPGLIPLTPRKQSSPDQKQSSPEKKQSSPEKKSNHETKSTTKNKPASDKTIAPEKASTPEEKTSSKKSPTPERKPTS